jgi:hypothetical protein
VTNCEVILEVKREMIDATVFGDVKKTYIVGVRDVRGEFRGGSLEGDIPDYDLDPTQQV